MGESTESLAVREEKADAQLAKKRRNAGKSYWSRKGNYRPRRQTKIAACRCAYRCTENLTETERQEVFDRFWGMQDWQTQSQWLIGAMERVPIKRKKKGRRSDKRTTSYIYKLNGKVVCQQTFLAALDIEKSRLKYLRSTKAKGGFVSPDKRGRHEPSNKTSAEAKERAVKFLEAVPKYKSHYSTSDRLYFLPTLNATKLYKQYTSQEKDRGYQPIGDGPFRRILKCFNVDFYVPRRDTCSVCDKLTNQRPTTDEAQQAWHLALEEHHQRANGARDNLRQTAKAAENDPSLLAFTFDLQKTQPMPYISTSVAFYKRQMWLHNCGISNQGNKEATMCLWTECEGKRDANEVASSLKAYLDKTVTPQVKNIKTFSDGCGGQNRNKKIVAFMLAACEHYCVESWEHFYMETGHSFLPNDTDFGSIDRAKKNSLGIFTFDEWEETIRTCRRKPFSTIHMKNKIYDIAQLTSNFTFRHQDTEHVPFSWLSLRWIRVEKGSSVVKFRTLPRESVPVRKVDFSKSRGLNDSRQGPLDELNLLYAEGVKLAWAKYADIQSLLPFVPESVREYYKRLPHNGNTAGVDDEYLPDEECD